MSSNLFVISGPSGVGKDTLMALIFKEIPTLKKWVTCTTREPREGETDGVQYFFKSTEEFKQMIDNGELVEYNEFAENVYGTPKAFAREMLEAGENIITAIDVHGAENVKAQFREAKLIFVEPPSLDELRNRLIKRGTESADYIEKRLAIVQSELEKKPLFDVSFVNDDLKKTCEQITSYIKQFLK